MTTNLDRATEIIAQHRAMPPRDAAQSLADATPPLLMPDLPEPDIWQQGREPIWQACGIEVQTAGYERRVLFTDEYGTWETSADDFRALAYALLAAANYAEGHGRGE